MVFEEKSGNHVKYSKYRCVYALLISFLKQFKKLFFHLIEHALRSLLVFKYLWLFLRKSKITVGDTLNSRLSIYVSKKVLVNECKIYYVVFENRKFTQKIVHEQDLISRAKPGCSPSMEYNLNILGLHVRNGLFRRNSLNETLPVKFCKRNEAWKQKT